MYLWLTDRSSKLQFVNPAENKIQLLYSKSSTSCPKKRDLFLFRRTGRPTTQTACYQPIIPGILAQQKTRSDAERSSSAREAGIGKEKLDFEILRSWTFTEHALKYQKPLPISGTPFVPNQLSQL
jgi:hypothetical protein